MTEAAGRFAGLTVDEAREAVVEALEQEGRIASSEPYTHTVPFSHRSGAADRAADLAPVVHADGRAGEAGDRGGHARARSSSTPSGGRGSTSTGSRTSGPGASPASCGGDIGCRSGTATRARRPTCRGAARALRRLRRRAAPGGGRARHLVLARRCGRSRRSAGRTTRRRCAPSTRPTCLSRRGTSSSSGSLAW